MRTLSSLPKLLALGIVACAAPACGREPSTGPCASVEASGGMTAQPLSAADGDCLETYAWEPDGQDARAVVVVAHGLHDHGRRYGGLAAALNEVGVAVYAFDQRGHGASGGDPQRFDSIDQLVGDLSDVAALARAAHPGLPVFYYGHSMGGLVVAHATARASGELAGSIVSSAALAFSDDTGPFKRRVVGLLSALFPGMGLDEVDPDDVVSSPEARAALAEDDVILRDPLPARTADTLLDGIAAIDEQMEALRAPLLILHGTADTLTEVKGSEALAERAGSSDKTLRLFDGLRHDMLHEDTGAEVAQAIVEWVSARVPTEG